jgi:DNA-binding CsgD family transcriptional regulator
MRVGHSIPGGGLVGRDDALTAIEAALAGAAPLVVIEGPAGAGKTSLLAAAQKRAANGGVRVIDDAHMLDGAQLLELAAADGHGAPALVAFRRGEPGAEEAGLDALWTARGATRVRLGPLDADAVAKLVRARHPDAGDELCREVHRVSGGNPLYVDELTAGDLTREHVTAVGERVLRRAGMLDADAPGLLRAMAVLGDGDRLELAAVIGRIDPGRVSELAHRLRRIDVLAREDPFRFAQPLVRRSIVEAMPDGERAQLHRVAARTLREAGRSAADVAAHLEPLAPEGSPEVASALSAAADASADAKDQARWLRRALAEGALEPSRVDLLHRLGRVEMLMRDAAAIDHLREAFDLARDRRQRARVGFELGEILALAGQWDEALAMLHLAEPASDAETEELRVGLSAVLAVATAHDAARVHIFEAERPSLEVMAHGRSWAAHALRALLATTIVRRGGPPDAAVAEADAALRDGVLLGEQGGGGWGGPQLLDGLILAEAHERAHVVCRDIESAARSAGSPIGHLVASGYRGWSLQRIGDLVRAEAAFRQAMSYMPQVGLPMIDATMYYVMSEALLERPTMADLAVAIEDIELEPDFRNTWSWAMVLWARGPLRLAGRDRAGGIADLREVGRLSDALGFGPAVVPWRSTLAQALGEQDLDEAEALVTAELELARSARLARGIGVALRARGVLTGGAAGVGFLEEATHVLRDAPARLELARALVDLGATLRRSRRPSDARERLEEGLELAVASGAVRLAARARHELGATAGRRARRPAADHALTPSELRVARLAASGVTNREIARELFISLKTVETHLARAYQKLGLAGRGARRELAVALDAYGG